MSGLFSGHSQPITSKLDKIRYKNRQPRDSKKGSVLQNYTYPH